MKLGIIIQARTGSTRLPNKMILDFFNKQTILDCLIDRIKRIDLTDVKIILATTLNSMDNKIEDIAKRNLITVFRGNESDVLLRFINAAENSDIDSIIRVCADNPFLSMNYLRQLIDTVKDTNYDYVSFCTSSGTPSIKTHYGLWTEFVTLEALKKINLTTKENLFHEHVTNYIYEHKEDFNIKWIPIDNFIEKNDFRLTVDTKEDFVIAQKLYTRLIANNKNIEPNSIIDYLDETIITNMKSQILKNYK